MTDLIRFPRLLVLILLTAFSTFLAVGFTPAFPMLANDFGLADSDAQWMMTVYLFGSMLGRLPYGPMANAWGRKKALFIGLGLSVVGSVVCLLAPSYWVLVLGRFIQALGASSSLTITYTMIADCHAGPKATKALSYVMVAFAIVPGIGTSVSGFLVESYEWRSSFAFLLAFSLLLMLSCLLLPETIARRDPHALRLKTIVSGYRAGFRDTGLVLHGCLMGLSSALLFIFSTEAPFIGMDVFGMTPQAYGVYYYIPAFGIAFGSFFTAWLAGRANARKSMIAGILLILLGTIQMFFFFSQEWFYGWALFVPQIAAQIGDALLYTNASSEALSNASDKARASTIILFVSGVFLTLGTFFAGVFSPKEPMAIPSIFLLLIALMLFFWLLLGRQHRSPA